MKQIKNIFMRGAAALALLSMPGLLFAQRAGDIISGVVSDSEGPLMMVNVTERDASNRIVASAVTDIEGQFSFRLVSPNNRIEVSYVGCETVNIPITKTYFEIVLNEITEIVHESSAIANYEGAPIVSDTHVKKALADRKYRANMIEEKFQEMLLKDKIMIDIQDSVVALATRVDQ